MTNSPKKVLNIAELVAPIVGSRDAVRALEKIISKEKAESIDLDFRDVEFVSRSATHEFLIMKEALAQKTQSKKTVTFINLEQNVKDMFRAVAANRAAPKSAKPELKLRITSIESLITNSQKAVV